MARKEPNSPFNSQKKFSKYNKLTVDTLRNEIRSEFKQRIQSQRNKQRDLQRNLRDDEKSLENLIRESGEDIKQLVLSEKQDDLDYVLDLIAEVEQEVFLEEQQIEANMHEQELESEVHSLLPKCIACEKVLDEYVCYQSLICKECSVEFNAA